MKYIQIMITVLMMSTYLNAAPARTGLVVFEQPDGTTFEGFLKGDAAFHWIESNGHIVLQGAQDGFYYNATINEKGGLQRSSQKPQIREKRAKLQSSSFVRQDPKLKHSLDTKTMKALHKMQIKSRKGNHPR